MKQVETTREAIINRRSVRKYKTDMIPRDIIERIVEAGTYAANGRGHQASIILAVTNKELRDRLSEMNRKIGDGMKDLIRFMEHLWYWLYWQRKTGQHMCMMEVL